MIGSGNNRSAGIGYNRAFTSNQPRLERVIGASQLLGEPGEALNPLSDGLLPIVLGGQSVGKV